MTTAGSAIIRCDGSRELGLGHVVRCLAIADELRDREGYAVSFAMRTGALGLERVRSAGYPVTEPPAAADFVYTGWLQESIGAAAADVLVLDVRDELSRNDIETLITSTGVIVATIDDISDRRLAADLSYLPPVPQARRLDWREARGEACIGWEWVPLRAGFAEGPRADTTAHPARVLVTMGGSDPLGLTLQVVEALAMLDAQFETLVALGPGFDRYAELEDLQARSPREFTVVRDPDLATLMRRSTLSVASFGVTAYELAAIGVPAVYLALTADHAESASAFVEAGLARSLGVASALTTADIAGATSALLVDDTERVRMSERGVRLVDGAGAARIADSIARTSRDRNAERG